MHELNVTTKETVELDIKTQLIIIIHKRWVVVVDSRISWVASPPSPSFTMIAGRREDGENEIFKEIPWGRGDRESIITQEKKIISTEENSTEIYKRKDRESKGAIKGN